MSRRKFALDKQNAKWMGVCAGIARAMDWDVTLVRVGVVGLTIIGGFPWTLIAYALTGWLAPLARYDFGRDPRFDLDRPAPGGSVSDYRSNMRDIDRRLADVEQYVTSANGSLAREIDQLR